MMGWKEERGGENFFKKKKERKKEKGKEGEKSGKRMSTKGDLSVMQIAAAAIITGKNSIKQLGLHFSIPVT